MEDWLKELIERETGAIHYSKMNTTNTVSSDAEPVLTYDKIKEMCEKYLLEKKESGPIYDHYVLMDDGSIVGYKKPYYDGHLYRMDDSFYKSLKGVPDHRIAEDDPENNIK